MKYGCSMRKSGRSSCWGHRVSPSLHQRTEGTTGAALERRGLASRDSWGPCAASGGYRERRPGRSGTRAGLGLSGRGGPVSVPRRPPGLSAFPPAPPSVQLLHPTPTQPAPDRAATFKFTAGSSIPTPAEGTCATAAGTPGLRTRGTNFPAPPVASRQLQPWLGFGPREANSRGHVTAARR